MALGEEITALKDQLDLLVRSPTPETADLDEALTGPLKRICSTLSMLGFDSALTTLQAQQKAVADLVASGDVRSDALLDIATGLISVEDDLHRIATGMVAGDSAIDDAKRVVMAEVRQSLEQVKLLLGDTAYGPWELEVVNRVDRLLCEASSALMLVSTPPHV